MSRTLYPPDKNPAVALYDLWFALLSAQGDLTRPSLDRFPSQTNRQPITDYYSTWTQIMPKVGYGDRITAIGIAAWTDDNRPILGYGPWYRPTSGIYRTLEIAPDGQFRLVWPHGLNHQRIERHTFLGYGWANSQYFWYVSPQHGEGQRLDVRDFRKPIPWVRERTLRGRQDPYSRLERWVRIEQNDSGMWEFRSDDQEVDLLLQGNMRRAQAIYTKAERQHYRLRGMSVPRLSVRAGKTVLQNEDAVRQIAVLLDVSSPAKVDVRPNVTEEVMV